jgi:Neuraminidase (sialidase)
MDKTFVAETTDGGKTFRFVSWVVPPDDPFRAVMPAVARLADGTIVATLRRRDLKDDKWNKTKPCWVDCYISTDNGRTWSFTSRVGETGFENGNPPALATLHDGRIVCVYGNRSNRQILARISADGGRTWEGEVVLRDDFQPDKFGDNDLGYPRVAVNHENHIVALYYWATKEMPQHHIPATIWHAVPDQ